MECAHAGVQRVSILLTTAKQNSFSHVSFDMHFCFKNTRFGLVFIVLKRFEAFSYIATYFLFDIYNVHIPTYELHKILLKVNITKILCKEIFYIDRTKTNTQNDTKTRTTPWRNRHLLKTIYCVFRIFRFLFSFYLLFLKWILQEMFSYRLGTFNDLHCEFKLLLVLVEYLLDAGDHREHDFIWLNIY